MMAQKKKRNDTPPWHEPHYTLNELSELWHFARATLRSWFINEPGVLKHHADGKIRPYVSLRIPASVANRVYQERTGTPPPKE